jgi:hypothetical protein
MQAHHIIPWEFVSHEVVQTAAKAPSIKAFHMNELINGIALEKTVHVEGMIHTAYSTQIRTALGQIAAKYPNGTLTPDIARSELETLIGKVRTWIDQNPGVNLNNIIIP